MSRSEGDGCTFSLITAIITQWWHNKLSNNYSLSTLPRSVSSSHTVPAEVFHSTNTCMPFILALKVKLQASHSLCCTSIWEQYHHRGGSMLPAEFKMFRWWLSITANLQDCWLNIRSYLTFTKKCTSWSAEGASTFKILFDFTDSADTTETRFNKLGLYSWFNKAFLD